MQSSSPLQLCLVPLGFMCVLQQRKSQHSNSFHIFIGCSRGARLCTLNFEPNFSGCGSNCEIHIYLDSDIRGKIEQQHFQKNLRFPETQKQVTVNRAGILLNEASTWSQSKSDVLMFILLFTSEPQQVASWVKLFRRLKSATWRPPHGPPSSPLSSPDWCSPSAPTGEHEHTGMFPHFDLPRARRRLMNVRNLLCICRNAALGLL